MNFRKTQSKCSFIIIKYNKIGLVSYFEMKSSCNITVMISVTVLLELFYVQLFLFFSQFWENVAHQQSYLFDIIRTKKNS
jgi:hypothetical protein